MKKLINKTSGQVIEITKIMRSEDKVVYNIYDNDICYIQNIILVTKLVSINLDILSISGLTYSEYLEYIALETIKSIHSEFIESEEITNWTIETSSNGNPTTVRILIPLELVGKVTNTGNALDLLIQKMTPFSNWVTRGEKSSVQYLEFLLPEDETILDSYSDSGVVINRKIIL